MNRADMRFRADALLTHLSALERTQGGCKFSAFGSRCSVSGEALMHEQQIHAPA